MKALQEYVAQKNAWISIFGKPALSLSNTKDRKEIARYIDSALSPENLHCDGEISPSAAMAKYRKLKQVAEQLKELDTSVTFYEL